MLKNILEVSPKELAKSPTEMVYHGTGRSNGALLNILEEGEIKPRPDQILFDDPSETNVGIIYDIMRHSERPRNTSLEEYLDQNFDDIADKGRQTTQEALNKCDGLPMVVQHNLFAERLDLYGAWERYAVNFSEDESFVRENYMDDQSAYFELEVPKPALGEFEDGKGHLYVPGPVPLRFVENLYLGEDKAVDMNNSEEEIQNYEFDIKII